MPRPMKKPRPQAGTIKVSQPFFGPGLVQPEVWSNHIGIVALELKPVDGSPFFEVPEGQFIVYGNEVAKLTIVKLEERADNKVPDNVSGL